MYFEAKRSPVISGEFSATFLTTACQISSAPASFATFATFGASTTGSGVGSGSAAGAAFGFGAGAIVAFWMIGVGAD